MNWNDLTVRHYQRIYPILTGELSDQDKVYQLILELEGKECSAADLERKISEYAFLSNIDIKPKPIKRFKANGRWYRFNYDIEKMPASRYIEIKTFMSGDFVSNMHMILASAVVPLKRGFFGFKDAKYEAENHNFYAEDMTAANFMEAYGSLVFFYLRLPLLTKDSHPYIPIAKTMRRAKRKAAKILSQNITDGYSQRSAWQSLSASLWSKLTT
jgi:hypothetical protein